MSPPKLLGSNLQGLCTPTISYRGILLQPRYEPQFIPLQLLLSNIKKAQGWTPLASHSLTQLAVSCPVFLEMEYNLHLDQNHCVPLQFTY